MFSSKAALKALVCVSVLTFSQNHDEPAQENPRIIRSGAMNHLPTTELCGEHSRCLKFANKSPNLTHSFAVKSGLGGNETV